MKKLILAFVLLLAVAGLYELSKTQQFNNFLYKPGTLMQQITPQAGSESSQTITLTQLGFSPDTVTVKAGTKVVWVNDSGAQQNVSSDPHPSNTDYPALNLGNFMNGSSLSLVFAKSGVYKYHNHLNPSQKGVIIVQ